MKIYKSLEEIETLPKPIALTIGTFDGVHKGHQHLFNICRSCVESENGTVCVLTFDAHPYTVLSQTPIPSITTTQTKLNLFNEYGIDACILIEFTPEFATTPYDTFIKRLRAHLPFDYLILGSGASFGKNREGNEETMKALSEELGFSIEFVKKLTNENGIPISSKQVRSLIQMGHFKEAELMLGHSFTIKVRPEKEKEETDGLGDFAMLCEFPNLCSLPSGLYDVHVDNHLDAIAKIESSGVTQKDLPSFITLYTEKELDPQIPHSLHFLKRLPD